MHSDNYKRKKVNGAPGINPPQKWVRLAIILAVTIPFFVAFRFIIEKIGYLGPALIMIPVLLAGWYFGVAAGLVAGLLAAIIVPVFLSVNEGLGLFAWASAGWPGMIILILGGYTSGLLHKAFIGRTRALDELHQRERYLTLINMATKEILAQKGSDNLYYQLVTRLLNLFVADYGYFVHWDAEQEQATLLTSTIPLAEGFSGTVLDADESALTKAVMESGDPIAIEHVTDTHYVVNPAFFKEYSLPLQSAICIPLIAKEYASGAAILTFSTPHHFTSEELEVARLAGSQLTLVLRVIEQGLKIQEQLNEANAFANVEHILSEVERVGIKTVLQFIVDSARSLIPKAGHAILHLVDTEKQILVSSAVAGFTDEPGVSLNMRLGEGIAGQVFITGEVIIVSDTQTDPRFLNRGAPVSYRSLIVAPIKSKQQCVGTISVHSDQPNTFTPGNSRMLATLGAQAAVAIENTNMLEATQRDLKQINALYHMSQGLVASLDPDRLMKDIAEFLHDNFGYYHVQIYAVDPENGDLIVRQGSGEIGTQRLNQKFTLPAGAGIVGHTAEIGEPFFTNNVDEVIFFIRGLDLPDTQSEMAIPIKVEDRVVGVLDIQQTPPGYLTQSDLELMTAVADQLAVALQKAQLYNDLQNSLRQEQAARLQLIHAEKLAVTGRLLASVSHELNNPLQAIQNTLFLLQNEERLSTQGKQDLNIILSETERMATLLERLRIMYQPARPEDFKPVQINNTIEDVHALVTTHLRHAGISFEFHPDPDLPSIPGLDNQLKQVMLNLFMNAVDAMAGGGLLTVSTAWLAEIREILITVTDTGAGIDESVLPNIFEAFITSKEKGTGLGLAISYEIVLKHHGRIRAENNPQGGAILSLWLPVENGATQ